METAQNKKKCQYLGFQAKNGISKATLFSGTLKVKYFLGKQYCNERHIHTPPIPPADWGRKI